MRLTTQQYKKMPKTKDNWLKSSSETKAALTTLSWLKTRLTCSWSGQTPDVLTHERYQKPDKFSSVLIESGVWWQYQSELKKTKNSRRLDTLNWDRGNLVWKIDETFIQTSSKKSSSRWPWASNVKYSVNLKLYRESEVSVSGNLLIFYQTLFFIPVKSNSHSFFLSIT